MFTGIIQHIGTISQVRRRDAVTELEVHASAACEGLKAGESVAVNGVCLTVVRAGRSAFTAEVIPETQRLTTLGRIARGDAVNLERSLRITDRLSGHLVLGHVDGMGRVLRRAVKAREVGLELAVDRSVGRYLVPKGPITIDGVSLTLGSRVSSTRCQVFIIPETMHRTTVWRLQAGDLVNIEVDYFAKLIAQLAGRRTRR